MGEVFRRIRLFLGIVWRPDPGYPDECGMRLTIGKSWDIAKTLHPGRGRGPAAPSQISDLSAKRFAESTPTFWSVAVNQGHENPYAESYFKFAEAYFKWRTLAAPSEKLAERGVPLEETEK